MIIIEGVDGGGKSTAVKWIRQNTPIHVAKPYYPKKNQVSYYLHSPAHYAGRFLERYYLSEVVYPQFKEGRDLMYDWQRYLIEAAIMPFNPVILYLRPDRETILENIKRRGDDYIDLHEIDVMIETYDKEIEASHIPHIKYNYQTDDLEEKINECLDLIAERSWKITQTNGFLSSGDSVSENGIMFIGDDPSNKSIGEGFIRAFISDKGSSAFLHMILDQADIYEKEMPYFTNWGKGYDNDEDKIQAIKDEIALIKPRIIISLGKNPILQSKIPLVYTIEHPSYVKRFHSKDYRWYVNKIKDLINPIKFPK